MARGKILVVDDENLVRRSLGEYFRVQGYRVSEAEDAAGAWVSIQAESPDVVLLDVRLPDRSGIELLEQMKKEGANSAVIMITVDPRLDDIKRALALGAHDFISKPLDFDELSVTVKNALEAQRLRRQVDSLRDEVVKELGVEEVVGPSKPMRELMEFVRKVAASGAETILIQGESGTGKDLIAKVIHAHSERSQQPFVAINCAAIPETLIEAELFGHEKGAFTDAKAMKKGLLEVADGGTVFLDEIGELSPFLQVKLLRVLEDHSFRRVGGLRDLHVDVRVIAASNRDLERDVRDGRFREDLFYRLSVISMTLPPLRERKEDILPLVEHFIAHYNYKFRKQVQGLSKETEQVLLDYDWPGNVRELKNAIERAMILEEEPLIRPLYLPIRVTSPGSAPHPSGSGRVGETQWEELPDGRWLPRLKIPPSGTSLEAVEQALVEEALRQAHGNQTQAARLLNISRDALRYKMKKYNLGDVK